MDPGPSHKAKDTEAIGQVSDPKPNAFRLGSIVWAKISGSPWWPAMVVDVRDLGIPCKATSMGVFWFGDEKFSVLNNAAKQLDDFKEGFGKRYRGYHYRQKKKYITGVFQAIQVLATRQGFPELSRKRLLKYAEYGLPDAEATEEVDDDFVPEFVVAKLRAQKQSYDALHESSDSYDIEEDDSTAPKQERRVTSLKKICMSCKKDQTYLQLHPLFKGNICKQCLGKLMDNIFQRKNYCGICYDPGSLQCKNEECERVYCRGCIECLGSVGAVEKIVSSKKWLCFMCAHEPAVNGLIEAHPNWQGMLVAAFNYAESSKIVHPISTTVKQIRPIRVLSIYDGVGAGLYTLNQMKLQVEEYFIIEEDEVDVRNQRVEGPVSYLKSAAAITPPDIAKLGGVDLVLGGSAICHQITDAASTRGVLEFYRILTIVRNFGCSVLWLLEIEAEMSVNARNFISRLLGCGPFLIFVENKAKFFWGNIPRMQTAMGSLMIQDMPYASTAASSSQSEPPKKKRKTLSAKTAQVQAASNVDFLSLEKRKVFERRVHVLATILEPLH